MQPDWWKYVVDVAQILTAIGTCGAVVVALWIASRPPKLHFAGSVGMRQVVTQGSKGIPPSYVVISVTNNGERDFIVKGLTWVTQKKKDALSGIQLGGVSDVNVSSSEFPKKLAFGETAQYFLRGSGEQSWFALAVKRPDIWLDAYSRKESLKSLRLVVSTSIGTDLKIKPEQGFINQLWDAIEPLVIQRRNERKSK